MQVPPADWSTGRTAGPLSSFAELRRATLRHPNMRMPRRSVAIPALLAFVVLVAACGTSAATPASSAGPSSAPAPTANIIQSAADAARAVTNEVPLFAGIEPRDANLIGQATWYEATPQEAAKPPVPWRVVFRVGWGDCPAGCIDEHTWTYEVGVDGSVTFVTEAGSPVPPAVFETLRAASSFTGVAGRVTPVPPAPSNGRATPPASLGPSKARPWSSPTPVAPRSRGSRPTRAACSGYRSSPATTPSRRSPSRG